MGHLEDALRVNLKALEVCDRKTPDYTELESQKKRFQEKQKQNQRGNICFGGVHSVVKFFASNLSLKLELLTLRDSLINSKRKAENQC